MHRVELKAGYGIEGIKKVHVPNAPCGVESLVGGGHRLIQSGFLFLMHRVELKEMWYNI